MAASRSTRHADLLRVDLVLAGIRPEPADRRLRVVNRRRKLVFGRQPIGDGRRDIAALRQLHAQRVVRISFARPEAAAVNAQHRRKRTAAFFRTSQIELQVFAVWIRILNPLFPHHGRRHRCAQRSTG